MKFGPKEIKELNEYLRTGRNRKREFLGGGITFASDLTQPEPKREVVEIDAINAFMKRNPRADGGRIGFYKAGFVESNPPGQQYVVKFASKNMSPDYPNKFIGTQKYATEELANQAIEERKLLSEKKYQRGVKKSSEIARLKKEKLLKSLVDDVFETGNFLNFKSKPTESQLRFAKKQGKVRRGTGNVPAQYINQIKKAVAAGVDSPEFKDLLRITGRTSEEILELYEKAPMGKVPVKVRSQATLDFPPKPTKTKEEKLATQRKTQKVRADLIKEAKKFASEKDLQDLDIVEKGKQNINKFFQNNPDAINNTAFGKQIKAMMSLRVDQDGKFFSKLMSDEYFRDKAAKGDLFDLFDVKPVVGSKSKFVRVPYNINISPGQFNQAFIQGQVSKLFEKGVNPETLKNLNQFLTERNIRVELPNVGYTGAKPDVAVQAGSKRGTRTFPRIVETLKSLKAPPEILKNFIDITPFPGALKPIKKLLKADGGRIGFESGTIPGGYTDDAYNYLREIDEEIFQSYKKYRAGGGKMKYGPYAYNAKRQMFGPFGVGVGRLKRAGGGLLKQAGDRSGAPPERGPNPQGLPGLLKRVKNL